ncbi:MAG: response regulator [Pirellulaceae bacterium]
MERNDPPQNAAMPKRKSVLYIEDDKDQAQALISAMKREFEVTLEEDGNRGLAIIKSANPDLVILDLGIPRRSGFLILEELREKDLFHGKVIVLTGAEGKRHFDYSMALGADAYIRKPYSVDEVIETCRSLLA